jgi:hypothetical protein
MDLTQPFPWEDMAVFALLDKICTVREPACAGNGKGLSGDDAFDTTIAKAKT